MLPLVVAVLFGLVGCGVYAAPAVEKRDVDAMDELVALLRVSLQLCFFVFERMKKKVNSSLTTAARASTT